MADSTVNAGRGVLYIAVAKLYFMMAGYVIAFTLPRLLHSTVDWGKYMLVVGLVSVINNVIVTGSIQGVSRFTAQAEGLVEAVKRAGLKVQAILGGGITVVYVLGAPLIAAFERDASLTGLYRISGGIVLCYSFYAVFVGSLNGQRRFGHQATLDMTFATLRATAILGAAALGLGVAGSVGGFAGAAAVIMVASATWVGLPGRQSTSGFSANTLLLFMLRLFVYTLCLNLIMRMDLILLKRFAGALGDAVGAVAQADLASMYSGYYASAQTLAFIPYQAILAVAFVIFPLISRSTFEDDLARTQQYIKQTMRFSLIFATGVAVVFMANPESVIQVPYPAVFRVGGPALRLLAGGMVCFSMFTIINTILNSAGRTADTILSGVVTLALVVATNALLIPRAGSPASAMELAAGVTMGSMAVGMLLSMMLLQRRFQASFPGRSVVRVLVAMAVTMGVGQLLPEVSRLVTLAESVGLFVFFFVVLAVLREFTADDLTALKRIIRRGR